MRTDSPSQHRGVDGKENQVTVIMFWTCHRLCSPPSCLLNMPWRNNPIIAANAYPPNHLGHMHGHSHFACRNSLNLAHKKQMTRHDDEQAHHTG